MAGELDLSGIPHFQNRSLGLKATVWLKEHERAYNESRFTVWARKSLSKTAYGSPKGPAEPAVAAKDDHRA